MEFTKIVNKLEKKGQILWSIDEFRKYIVTPKEQEQTGLYRLTRRLVKEEKMKPIRKGLYLWHTHQNHDKELYYWQIVSKMIQQETKGSGLITGEKALALILRDYSLPDNLLVLTKSTSQIHTIMPPYRLIYQSPTLPSPAVTITTYLKKNSHTLTIEGAKLTLAPPEHAILETLMVRLGQDLTETHTLMKYLKKYANSLREDVFTYLVQYRYISAINRLKYIAQDLSLNTLAKLCIRVIDRDGKGCHLSRNFLKRQKKI